MTSPRDPAAGLQQAFDQSSYYSIHQADLDRPDFEHTSRVHDWRNYIPEEVETLWGSLSLETRMVAAMIATIQADREEWD